MNCDLSRQIDELEALRAMYPEDEGCFVLAPAEQAAWDAAVTAVQAGDKCPPGQPLANLSGTVRLPGVHLEQQPVALRFQLPPGYPSCEPPSLSVECSTNRTLHEQLSQTLRDAAEAAVGSESLLLLMGVLQEAVADAAASFKGNAASNHASHAVLEAVGLDQPHYPPGCSEDLHHPPADRDNSTNNRNCQWDVLQVVVWFHHIKSTEKRKNLVSWARDLNCRGFSKPGFPGVVVVEGAQPDVREYIARVRALQWQAMQVRAEKVVLCAHCAVGSSQVREPDDDGFVPAQNFGCSEQKKPNTPAEQSLKRIQDKFTELPESGLSQLGQACKEAGMEDLFLAALKLR